MRVPVHFRPLTAMGSRSKHPHVMTIGTRHANSIAMGQLTCNFLFNLDTPTAIIMPSQTATRLIAEYGGPEDYKFAGAVQLKTATTIKGSTLSAVTRYEPWTNKGAAELLKYHPVAIWKELEVRLAPRAGIYGRMCTFYGGWAAAGVVTPTTVEEMVSLHGAIDVTYGGTGDPGTVRVTIKCDFDDTMKDVLRGPSSEEGTRPVFFYAFTESDVADKALDADRFMMTFRGKYTLHGRY
jgi:hypothetical protein